MGSTIGEKLLGLQLVDYEGEPARWLRNSVHALGTTLGVLLLFQGYFWAAVDVDRQGLANYLSRTMLIVEDSR